MKTITSFLYRYKIALLCFFIFVINIYLAVKYMQAPVFTDENETMANGALLSGIYDWSDSYSSSVSMYWGYGYALLWIPLFWIFKDMFLVYKAIGIINSIVISVLPVIIDKFILQNFKQFPEEKRFLTTVILSLYPTGYVVSKFAWNEPMFLLLQWVILYVFFKTYREEKNKIGNSILLGILCTYACAVHERGIIFVAVIAFTSLFIYFFAKVKIVHFVSFVVTFFVGYQIHKQIKGVIVSNLLDVNANMARNTAESVISLEVIKQLLNLQNLKQILVGVNCQGYYIVFCTLGLISIVIISFFVIIYKYKKNDKNISLLLLSIYTNALIAATLIVSVIFYYKSYITNTTRGVEYYFYGRYNESSICIGILLSALFVFYFWSKKKKLILFCSVGTMSLFAVTVAVCLKYKILHFAQQMFNENNIYFIVPFGTSDMVESTNVYDFIQISIILISVTVILWGIVCFQHYRCACLSLLCLFGYILINYTDSYLIERNREQYNGVASLINSNSLTAFLEENHFENIYLTDVPTRTLTMQFLFPSYNVKFLNTETYGYQMLNKIEDNSIIISMRDEQFHEWLQNCYFVEQIDKYYIWEYSTSKNSSSSFSTQNQVDKKTLKTAYEKEKDEYSIVVNNYQSGSAIFSEDSCIATQTCIFLKDGKVMFPNRIFLGGEYELNFTGNELENMVVEIYSDSQKIDAEILYQKYENDIYKLRLKFNEIVKNATVVIHNSQENSTSYFTQLDIIPLQ